MSTFAALTNLGVMGDNVFVEIFVSDAIHLDNLMDIETAIDRVHINVDTLEFRSHDGLTTNATIGLHVLNLQTADLIFENNLAGGYGNIAFTNHGQTDIGLTQSLSGRRGPRDLYLFRNIYFGDGSTVGGLYNISTGGAQPEFRAERLSINSLSGPGDQYFEILLGVGGFYLSQTNMDFRINDGARLIFFNNTGTAALDRAGNATLVGGTVTVTNTTVTANTIVFMSVLTPGGVQGFLDYDINAGASFTINSSNIADTSTVSWALIEMG